MGVDVVTKDGIKGFVDNLNMSSWLESGLRPQVGDSVNVVVLDETRRPFRASTLAEDFRIAKNE